jgi:hypothetical protein
MAYELTAEELIPENSLRSLGCGAFRQSCFDVSDPFAADR